MTAGYIYILQNAAFGSYVVKIGLTTRAPDLRASEIYAGATGVPMPFEIAHAFSVGDCEEAERRIHKRLATYRLNRRREFFRVPPRVAATVVQDICSQINSEHSMPPPSAIELGTPYASQPPAIEVAIQDSYFESDRIYAVRPEDLRKSAIGTSCLTPEQHERSRVLSMIFHEVFPWSGEQWVESFSRDEGPERELRIWESMAKAFMLIDQVDLVTEEMKKEAFVLLLARSMSPTSEVLREVRLRNFSRATANRLLKGYELKPIPLAIRVKRKTG